MTYEEARNLLADMRAAKRRANAIKARIADIESDAQSISSALNNSGVSGGIMRSRVEDLALKVETEREKHMAALEAYFALEDKLAAAIDTLEPLEKEIILAFYLDGKPNWKVGEAVGLEERTVRRYKRKATQKIADIL